MGDKMKKDVISILDVGDKIPYLLELALKIKGKVNRGEPFTPMSGMTLGMLFEKPSTRTRLSFEVGATQLGGHAIFLGKNDLQIGRGETISDTGSVMSRYVDIIMYRAFEHSNVLALAESSSVPVINALDDVEHPCQILADLLTIREKKGDFGKIKLSYVGDGNNVCNSLMLGAASVGLDISVCAPKRYFPPDVFIQKAKKLARQNHSKVIVTDSIIDAVSCADVIYTDVWLSMGDEDGDEKTRALEPYSVNEKMAGLARDDFIFMHCLPAHRGMEVTDGVIDSANSVVFDQAENRLHAQKALMVYLLGLDGK